MIKAAFSFFAAIFILTSCKKENSSPNLNIGATSSDDISVNDAPGIYKTTSGYTKLVLQPGDDKGQDTWIDFFNGNDSSIYNNGNAGSVDQIKCDVWTMFGGVVKERSLIRFDDLSQVPSNSRIIAAKMFLHGLSSSPIHLPQGNSYYPGSPYYSYGPNDIYVKKITSSWDENTVTWNSRPSVSVYGESLISPSTSQWNYNASTDVTRIARYFINNPDKNFGFMLSFVDEDIYRSMGFYSSEYTDAAMRPKLVILYK
jgi:hypothetical protein